ncbi:hypothetical protein B0H14DRAFT_2665860 [Mycena olivaceomarginata]|nr:hypothetical protein B0H14DRAFT_2665860 [Mycena olivaceomarginata]
MRLGSRFHSTAMAASKYTISALPLAPPAQLLTHQLTPDPRTPSVPTFRNEVLATGPSIQRRARLLAPEAHYSYVTPFPVPFPYNIEPPSPTEQAGPEESSYIEKWLAAREPRIGNPPATPNASLCKYIPELYDNVGEAELLGIAETGLRDCVPHLDAGDAFTLLGSPELTAAESEEITDGSESAVAARKDLIDVLSGRAVLMSDTFAPWAVRYSGHQFGQYAGQLGDGRATSILVTPHPGSPELSYELQLKGAGRTPFSRSADGLAVTRSSVREYLCSEAMHALGIPTTRSLALISLPGVPVLRETVENACVLTRVAPSFLRIGSFEALSPPQNIFLFGGGQQVAHWDGLRTLGIWVARTVLKLPGAPVLGAEKETEDTEGTKETQPAPWGKALVLEVARRNARMVAGWQAYGFMHGVINTDNVSILGLTIDYGPYAFMDVFDPFHICNHTDEEGRYAYRSQPTNILFALRALHAALAPLIGAEAELGHAVPAGWADGADKEKIAAWRTRGMDELKDELERVFQGETAAAYGALMRKRFALRHADSTDEAKLVRPFLDLLAAQKLDFHGAFRVLTAFHPGMLPAGENTDSTVKADLDKLIERLLSQAADGGAKDRARATEEWREWLGVYARRIEIEREAGEWGDEMDIQRTRAGRAANPRFVLRQWLLQEVIAVVEKDSVRGRRVLAKVLHMACNPFEPWGGEDADNEAQLSAEEREERRFCGLGDSRMLGFQCSCSS